jgi:hypothetical protein
MINIVCRTGAVVLGLSYLAVATSAAGRPDGSDTRTGAARLVNATSTPGVSIATRATTILGSAWAADNSPLPQAHIRLRNAITGHVAATAIADAGGRFEFLNVEAASYLVELVNDSGKIQVVGHVFTIAPGETVATFVRLPAKAPWFTGFFSNTVSAISSTAASEGITALAPIPRPVSANK